MAKRMLLHEDKTKKPGDKDRYRAGVIIDDDSLEVWGIFKNYLIRNGEMNTGYAKLFVESREAEWGLQELSQIISYQDEPDPSLEVSVNLEAEESDFEKVRSAVAKAQRVTLKNPYGLNN